MILTQNESIVDLNLGSLKGAQRNRLGKEGCLAISYSLNVNTCLVQFLKLRSVTMCNEDVELLADSLQDYLYLL